MRSLCWNTALLTCGKRNDLSLTFSHTKLNPGAVEAVVTDWLICNSWSK